MKFHQVHFVIDEQYRLLWIGGEWDEFALANGGARARANEVLSTSLLAHIGDEPTRRAMIRLIEAVRTAQNPIRIEYRCDSPRMLRRFLLTIQPMKERRVLLVHDLRDARTFEPPLAVWAHNPEAGDEKCSFCCAVRPQGSGWVPPEALDGRHPRDVRYVLCPECEARIETEVARLRGATTEGA